MVAAAWSADDFGVDLSGMFRWVDDLLSQVRRDLGAMSGYRVMR